MKQTTTSATGNIFTTYTAKQPYKISSNGLKYFKQLITWDNSKTGRVVFDRKVLVQTVKSIV